MTTPIRAVFFDSAADASAALTTAVTESAGETLGRIPGAAREAVLAEAGEVAAGILEMDVQDVFALAWAKYAALRDAAVRTRDDPSAEEMVELAGHTLTFEQRPAVEIRIGDLAVASIEVRVCLEILVRWLLAVIRSGRVIAVKAGAADLTGTLEVAGQQVVQRRATIYLPAVVRDISVPVAA
ncbi:hypothetical protein [Actinoplanes sp. NBRC 101535]|uniref:hypothetical protein n=1 Tax=Actinoplanes sp. NBRC 101535 TaxID=3032196 RepID=UPI0024A151B8|nr:hypothetical protein [Actinoplanes sp. NBRC 101535]GLY05296.1 hypothetical protein Acsp01_56750 [Actinoplanes sp. NBRC 101535]